jgi:DNA-binding NarL/FixJ family response regulator
VIRVLIAEDHALVRAGLAELLENRDDVEVVAQAANGAEAVARATEARPDVVLMDLSMPEMDGIEATRQIAASVPDANVVVLTSFSDRERILEALDAGAVGYLLKDLAPDELHRGIQAAARGESPLAPKAAHAVLTARSEAAKPSVELSVREREVLGLVAEGLPNKLIARRLEISEKTVKAHLTRVFQQIGVTDRTQAALWAQRHGVARGPDGAAR